MERCKLKLLSAVGDDVLLLQGRAAGLMKMQDILNTPDRVIEMNN